MKAQLTKAQLTYIESEIVKPLKKANAEVYLFGSRSTGKANIFSDVDLLVRTSHYEDARKILSEITEKVQNGNFELKIDIVLEEDLAHEYKEKIYQEMILLTEIPH